MYIKDLLSWNDFDEAHLNFYRAIGVDMICLDIRAMHKLDPDLDFRDGRDTTGFFSAAREKVETHGMRLNSIFMAGWDEITLGKPDCDEKIEAWCRMLRCIGAAGIPSLGYNFKPMGNFRTESVPPGRGGTAYSTFDYEVFDRNRPEPHSPRVSEDDMWGCIE